MTVESMPVRIERVRPRRIAWRNDLARSDSGDGPAEIALDDERAMSIELTAPGVTSRLADRWARVRERWAQTTFYLFDADSWRR